MTKNQIEYLKLRETQRANLKNESLTEMRDKTAKELGFGNLAETSRHNQATERHNTYVLGETQRHNLAQESLNAKSLEESARHNLSMEGYYRDQLTETQRSNLAREGLERGKLSIQASQVHEQARHNQVVELETRRSNVARESEMYRSNVTKERENERANRARETESNRSNLANEQQRARELEYSYSSLSEARRYHDMSVSLGYGQLGEQTRSNMARESETYRTNVAHETETNRANLAREQETRRSNVVSEFDQRNRNRQQFTLGLANVGLGVRTQTEVERANQVKEAQRDAEVTQKGWSTVFQGVDSASRVARNVIPIFGGVK